MTRLKSLISTAFVDFFKSTTFAQKQKPYDMSEYTFEMVPQLVGRIAELLESIDRKIEKVTVQTRSNDDVPRLMSVKDLSKYLPSHPSSSTIYGWCCENSIPYYKQGKHSFFKRSEIDQWLLRTRVKDSYEVMEEAQRYCATHPIGSRRR